MYSVCLCNYDSVRMCTCVSICFKYSDSENMCLYLISSEGQQYQGKTDVDVVEPIQMKNTPTQQEDVVSSEVCVKAITVSTNTKTNVGVEMNSGLENCT